VLKLEPVAAGLLNAVVFWFDLHLDDEETLTNGELQRRAKGRCTPSSVFL
jgi:hypothetical protein